MNTKNPNSVGYMYNLLDFNTPFNTQESWDNAGLNVGSLTQEFENLYVALELDATIAQEMKPNSLIITHHPLFFKSFKNFDIDTYPANLAQILLRKNCSLISIHTNFDKSHLNEFFTHNVLGFSTFTQEEIVCFGSVDKQEFQSFVAHIKQKLGLASLRVCEGNSEVENVFVICGSGFGEIECVDRICNERGFSNVALLSGDLKYHDAMKAKSLNIGLIDIPHYESEKYFTQIIHTILQNAKYQAIIMDSKNPITIL